MPTTDTRSAVYAEDIQPGDTWHLGSYTLSEDEIVAFASKWDPQFLHVDVARAATQSQFGGLIASGLHTLGVYQRLSVLSRLAQWRVIAGAGLEEVRFLRPVRPGDTLTGQTRIEAVEMDEVRGRGLVTCAGELTNQHGKQVFSIRMAAYVEARAA